MTLDPKREKELKRREYKAQKRIVSGHVGDLLFFAEEKRPYRIRAIGKRFAVCTKPFNPKHTVLYTIVDFKDKVRGTENLVFGMGAETDEQCREMLARLESGESEVSHRNRIPLRLRDCEDKP